MSSTTGSSVDWLGRRRRRRVAGPGAATKSARPASDLDELGEDRERDLLGGLGTEVEPGGARRAASRSSRDARLVAQPRAHDVGSRRRGDEPHVRRHRARGRPPAASSSQMPCVATTTYGATTRVEAGEVGAGHDALGRRERVGLGDRVDDGHPPARGGAEGRERAGDRGRAGDPEDRRRQMRFHVDLQGAPGVAGHDQFDDAVAAPTLGRGVLREAQQPGLAVDERSGAPRGRRRAGRSCRRPSPRSCRPDGRCPTRPGRAEVGRWTATTVATTNGRPAASSSAARAKMDRPVMRISGGRVHEMPFSWRIAQTFWGVIGMSMFRTPRCHRASTTALAIAGGAPTVADSPTPLAPIG